MKQLLKHVYWGDVTSGETYLYGSMVTPHDKTISFENLAFPSGKPIKVWQARTNYQANRFSPALPLLCPGRHYMFTATLDVFPEDTVYFYIQFYNRQSQEVGSQVIRGDSGVIHYPKEAFTYRITLVSGGCSSLLFKRFSLYGEESKSMVVTSAKTHRYRLGTAPQALSFIEGLSSGEI